MFVSCRATCCAIMLCVCIIMCSRQLTKLNTRIRKMQRKCKRLSKQIEDLEHPFEASDESSDSEEEEQNTCAANWIQEMHHRNRVRCVSRSGKVYFRQKRLPNNLCKLSVFTTVSHCLQVYIPIVGCTNASPKLSL